jgi:hypothetical protein
LHGGDGPRPVDGVLAAQRAAHEQRVDILLAQPLVVGVPAAGVAPVGALPGGQVSTGSDSDCVAMARNSGTETRRSDR